MDPWSYYLDGPRARHAFTRKIVMDPPWGLDVQDQAALTLMLVLEGSAWIEADGALTHLDAGSVAIVRGPDAYRVLDRPDAESSVRINSDQGCTTVGGDSVEVSMALGVSTWGNSLHGQTSMLIGTYDAEGAVGAWVTAVLPRLAVMSPDHADDRLKSLAMLLDCELGQQQQGKTGALDRLLDLLLLHVVRRWSEAAHQGEPNWSDAHRDPLVAQALSLIHEAPAASWTVAELARRCFVSRATLAARFKAAVGVAPMSYLSQWRLTLASERLTAEQTTAATIATDLGFSSPFAFSTAFKKAYGASPTSYRRQAARKTPQLEAAL